MKSLKEIQSTLLAALGSEALFALINTRITLRTGVDLRDIRAADDVNTEVVARVLDALSALGFSAASLQVVAQRRASR